MKYIVSITQEIESTLSVEEIFDKVNLGIEQNSKLKKAKILRTIELDVEEQSYPKVKVNKK